MSLKSRDIAVLEHIVILEKRGRVAKRKVRCHLKDDWLLP